MPTTLHRLAAGVLLGFVLGSAPVRAQIVVEPQSLTISVSQHETETQNVTLTNTSTESLAFCLSFGRPLQREGGKRRLANRASGISEPCGEYGEILYRYDDEDFGAAWSLYSIAMTSGGRLFVAEQGGALSRTFEFTSELHLLRFFDYPYVAELVPFAATAGVTFDPGNETLWWLNIEREGGQGGVTRRVLLLEGDLNGEETGRRFEVLAGEMPMDEFRVLGLSYGPATDLFYFIGILGNPDNPENWALWAVDREGEIAEDYPLQPEPYPNAWLNAPDVHGGTTGGSEGLRVEVGVFPTDAVNYDRIIVVDRWGNNQGTELETPVPTELFEAYGAGIQANPLRSRVDPNGMMYMTFTNFEHTGIVGVRPHPLPPSWLVVDSDAGPEAAWDGTLAPGESRELVLTFRAGAREVGDYTASLQAFEAATGAAIEVPLTLTVTPGVDTEDEAAPEGASRLVVYPNPARGSATVALSLAEASEVRVAVYDVLGRAVAVLHEGPLAAGEHALAFEAAGLPAGIYLIRAMWTQGEGAVDSSTHKLARVE